jgi:hypothetical protein
MGKSSLGKVPTQIKGSDIALPVDSQFSSIKASPLNFNTASIRDTNKAWLLTNQDWSGNKSVMFKVTNTLNQPVNIFLNHQNVGDYTKYDPAVTTNRAQITVPAGATEMLITPDDWPILKYTIAETLALGAQCTTAPTSGSLSGTAYIVPLGA